LINFVTPIRTRMPGQNVPVMIKSSSPIKKSGPLGSPCLCCLRPGRCEGRIDPPGKTTLPRSGPPVGTFKMTPRLLGRGRAGATVGSSRTVGPVAASCGSTGREGPSGAAQYIQNAASAGTSCLHFEQFIVPLSFPQPSSANDITIYVRGPPGVANTQWKATGYGDRPVGARTSRSV
jgi:hypothetical protein